MRIVQGPGQARGTEALPEARGARLGPAPRRASAHPVVRRQRVRSQELWTAAAGGPLPDGHRRGMCGSGPPPLHPASAAPAHGPGLGQPSSLLGRTPGGVTDLASLWAHKTSRRTRSRGGTAFRAEKCRSWGERSPPLAAAARRWWQGVWVRSGEARDIRR